MRKKLIEHNWLEIEKQESNPTQTWHRLRDESIRAINDLMLIARKLPEDKQKEIFTHSRIDDLVRQLLDGGEEKETEKKSKGFYSRSAKLAAILVEHGTNLHSRQYKLLNQDTPSLVEPTINHLRQAANICNDVSRKFELMEIEKEAEKEEMLYLFSWQRMFFSEKHRLEEFIINETGEDLIDISVDLNNWNYKKLECTFRVKNQERLETRNFSITMNDIRTEAEVLIFDIDHNIIYNNRLLVKPAENSRDDDFNIYEQQRTKKEKRTSLQTLD